MGACHTESKEAKKPILKTDHTTKNNEPEKGISLILFILSRNYS